MIFELVHQRNFSGEQSRQQSVQVSELQFQYLHVDKKPYQPELIFIRLLYPGQIGIWRCWFLWREENQRTWRKTLETRRETTTKLNPPLASAGIEHEPHLRVALATAPSLSPVSVLDAPWKFDVVQTIIFALRAALLWQILRTSNFCGATIS